MDMWGWFSPPSATCLIFYSPEWTLIPKIHNNTQNSDLPGINQASQRSLGEVWITVYVSSNRLRCRLFFLHHNFKQVVLRQSLKKTYKVKPGHSMCANTRGTSSNTHKLIAHVHACRPFETIPDEFLKYEIISTWHEVMSLHCPKQHWKNVQNA